MQDPKWMQIARGEVGVKEVVGKCHNTQIIRYHAATTLRATNDETPWCASFACYCLEQAGVTSPKSAASRAFGRWGRSIPRGKQRPGDIAVFRGASGSPSWSGHVGFVTEKQDKIGYIHIISGNVSDQVKASYWPASRLLSYRRPKTMMTSKTAWTAAALGTVNGLATMAPAPAVVTVAASTDVTGPLLDLLTVGTTLGGTIGAVSAAMMPLVNAFGLVYIAWERFRKMKEAGV